MACIEWPVIGPITQVFGETQPWGGTHKGIDIAAPEGTPVVAPYWGTVEIVRTGSRACDDPPNLSGCDWGAGGYGNYVDIRTVSGHLLRTAHHEEIHVTPGDVVERGDTIGTVGMTGVATGPHVHFEIRKPDDTPLDPYPYLVCDVELPDPPEPPPPPEPDDTILGVSLCVEGSCSRTGEHREVTLPPGRHSLWAGVQNLGGHPALDVAVRLNGAGIAQGLTIEPGGSWTQHFAIELRTISLWKRLEAYAANAPQVATELALHPSGYPWPTPAPSGLAVLGLVALTGIVGMTMMSGAKGKRLLILKKKGVR